MEDSNNNKGKCYCQDCLTDAMAEYIENSYLKSREGYADEFLALAQYLSLAAGNLTALLTSETNDLPAARSDDASKAAAYNLLHAFLEVQKLMQLSDDPHADVRLGQE